MSKVNPKTPKKKRKEYFKNICDISFDSAETWENKIFLTIDVDWVGDEILSYTLDIIEATNIKATIFCTHNTSLLDRMRDNSSIELGIHPNFNSLLEGNYQYGKSIDQVLEHFLKIIPEAVSVRSHTLMESSLISNSLAKFGLKYDCNQIIPPDSGITPTPWKNWNDLIKTPYFWEDALHASKNWKYSIEYLLESPGIKVFGFHPIHIFLNTSDFSEYQKAKKHYKNFNKLKSLANPGQGTRVFLEKLLSLKKQG